MNKRTKGILLVLATAFISGFAVFSNKFALASFNPFVFTTLKNSFVALFVFSIAYLGTRAKELKTLTKREWGKLALIGFVGGSIPFLLFFWGLGQTAASNAALLHKSLFVFASALAIIFLKEKISLKQLLATGLLFAGAFVLSGMSFGQVTIGDFAILAAVLLWSAENILSKHVLNTKLSANTVVFGRMFFGSLVMLAFLGATGSLPDPAALTINHFSWVLITSVFLLGYQLTYYNGLRLLKVSEATSILVLGTVVTSLLSLAAGSVITFPQALGGLLVMLAVSIISLFPEEVKSSVPVQA